MDSHWKRQSSRACEMCHRKKTKCEVEGSSATCVQCMRRATRCVLPAQREKQENLQRDDEYVQSLKERIVRVESLLKTAGILYEDDLDHQAFSAHENAALENDVASTSNLPSRRASSLEIKNGDLEGTPLFRADERDESRYIGNSCSLSILSRTGVEWIKRKTGDVSFLRIVSPDSNNDNPWAQWRPDVFQDLFASQVFKPLPPRSEVFSLMKDFFQTVNRLFPIYLESSFMKMVEWQYTQQTCDDAARWASINMVICLAYEYRSMDIHKSPKDKGKAELYFKNAMSVFTELALKRTDLLSVQALISMSFFLRSNSGTQAALPFLTAAMRSGQRMGLHRDISRPDLSPAAQEERRRVFWVVFVLDHSTCLRIGNAPSQHPDDFDVPLPKEMDSDSIRGSSGNINFFRQMCRLSMIKGRIYSQLYSAKALLRPPVEIYKIVWELHAELEEWNYNSPALDEPKPRSAERDFLFRLATMGLHFVYHNSLIMIHRVPLLLNYIAITRNEPEELQSISKAQAAKSGAIAAQAARDSLKLIDNMPWGDIGWTWSLLHYVFLAATTIFSNILWDPLDSQSRSDLQSLKMTAAFFASLTTSDASNNYAAGFMGHMSVTLERLARAVIEKEEKRALASNEENQEAKNPRGKNSRHTRQHRPTNPHTTIPSTNSNQALNAANQKYSGIPDPLEGLLPVNSSGYVVPMSPGPDTVPNIYRTFPPEAAGSAFPVPIPSWQLSQDFSAATSTLNSTIHTPDSYSNANPVPDFFQVPMSDDWDYSGNLFAGIIPTEHNFPPAHSAQVDEYPSMPILSAESFLGAPATDGYAAHAAGPSAQNLGYGYGPQGQGDQYQETDSAWSNGVLGLF